MDFTSGSEKFLFLHNIELFLCGHRKSAAYLLQPFGISKLCSPTGELQYPTTAILQGNFAFHCGGSPLGKQLFLLDISTTLSTAKGTQKWGGRLITALDIDTDCKCPAGISAFGNGHFCY